jgi:hypothetical protein
MTNTDTTTRVTHAALMADDAFRNAFAAICRRALPYMAQDAYHMDLLYDAEQATRLNPGDRFYLLVRKLGTNVYGYGDDAVKHCDPSLSDGQAVLKIVLGSFNTFTVTVIYDIGSGHRL